MNTLIVAPNWIGDAVMAQPLLALLARNDPQAHIEVLAPPQVAPVFAAMAEVAGVIEAPNLRGRLQLRERWQLARQLRGRYQRCYVLPNSLKSALIPFMAGIAQRHGHLGESRYLLLNRAHRSGKARHLPMVEHYARLAFPAQEPIPAGVPDPVLRVAPAQIRAARSRLEIEADAPLFVLCPGAEYGAAKRWPARHFGALANMIANEWPEAVIALLGSAKERTLATEIAALSGHELRNLCGETSLAEALALIAGADAVVSNDSGLMHVAAALRRPQVAVFGSSDPGHTPPRSPRARIEWLHLECSPCFERECPLGHTDCLNRIAPASVFRSLLGAMHSTTTSGPPR